jgi:hypothetical protein
MPSKPRDCEEELPTATEGATVGFPEADRAPDSTTVQAVRTDVRDGREAALILDGPEGGTYRLRTDRFDPNGALRMEHDASGDGWQMGRIIDPADVTVRSPADSPAQEDPPHAGGVSAANLWGPVDD